MGGRLVVKSSKLGPRMLVIDAKNLGKYIIIARRPAADFQTKSQAK